MVVTLFSGLTFQLFATAEIIGESFCETFFFSLKLSDVAKGDRLIMINSNEPER